VASSGGNHSNMRLIYRLQSTDVDRVMSI
jgi:hypothetical protein